MGAVDRPGGAVEGGVEAVTGGVVLNAAPPVKRLSHGRMVPFDQLLPGAVAQPCLVLGRADDVGEQHRREDRVHGDAHAARRRRSAGSASRRGRTCRSASPGVRGNDASARDRPSHSASATRRNRQPRGLAPAIEHQQRRHLHCGQNAPYVGLPPDLAQLAAATSGVHVFRLMLATARTSSSDGRNPFARTVHPPKPASIRSSPTARARPAPAPPAPAPSPTDSRAPRSSAAIGVPPHQSTDPARIGGRQQHSTAHRLSNKPPAPPAPNSRHPTPPVDRPPASRDSEPEHPDSKGPSPGDHAGSTAQTTPDPRTTA